MGEDTAARVQQLLAAADATALAPDSWRLLTARALLVADLIDVAQRSRRRVFDCHRVRHAPRSGTTLSPAAGAGRKRARRRSRRAQPAESQPHPTPTLDDLLVRYAAYDAALTALYTLHSRHSGDRSTGEFATLQSTVATARGRAPRPGRRPERHRRRSGRLGHRRLPGVDRSCRRRNIEKALANERPIAHRRICADRWSHRPVGRPRVGALAAASCPTIDRADSTGAPPC